MATHTLLEERDPFEAFLKRKMLSEVTINLYMLFLEKMAILLKETEMELNQTIVDAYLDAYPHAIGRAFLKNYLEFKNRRDLIIVKRTGRMPKKETITIPDNELPLIRDMLYSHGDRFGLVFDLTIACALRRQEVLGIKAGDIKIESEDKMFILIKKGKGNKERMVFVPKEIALLVVHYCFNEHLKPVDYLFRSKTNPEKNIDKTSWNRAFKIACLDAVGKDYHPHQLRHTRTTQWFNEGVDIVRIQQRLGHSNIATTRLYINPDNKKELERWSNE